MRIGVEETGKEGRAVGRREVLDGMDMWVGWVARSWMGRLGGGDSLL